ncbi:MAG: hypothetical protein ACK5KL_12950 [Dysgonomonas sp.]
MSRGLSPILLTLIIAALIFGLWFAAMQKGWFIRKTADDINICRMNSNTLQINWKGSAYGITGWSSSRYNDDILHVDLNLTKGRGGNIVLTIDTINVNYLEIYGKTISVREIPICK